VHFIQDGHLREAAEVVFSPDSPGLWYGDGLMETMLVSSGVIRLWDLHRERLLEGMTLLGYRQAPDMAEQFSSQVLRLCEAEGCLAAARVRLNVFRKEGALFEAEPSPVSWLIRARVAEPSSLQFQETGILTGLYTGVTRSRHAISHLKTQSYLASVMAARYAASRGWGDALLLNDAGRVAESAIANVFIVRDGVIRTPPLREGCVAGVMRRHLLETLPARGYQVREQPLTPRDLQTAEEIFLTNAIRRVRPVAELEGRRYRTETAREIFSLVTV
jgi:branched-chain amino acid aminotransferase